MQKRLLMLIEFFVVAGTVFLINLIWPNRRP